MVPGGGLEPPTSGSTIQRSNQLSYPGLSHDYARHFCPQNEGSIADFLRTLQVCNGYSLLYGFIKRVPLPGLSVGFSCAPKKFRFKWGFFRILVTDRKQEGWGLSPLNSIFCHLCHGLSDFSREISGKGRFNKRIPNKSFQSKQKSEFGRFQKMALEMSRVV